MTIAATGIVLALASACGGGEAPPAASTGEIAGDITFSFWGNPARAEKVDAVIDLFAEEHPDVDVTPEVADYNSYIERLTVRSAGGNLPCVSGTQSTFYAQYVDTGVLRPLDDLIESGQIDTSGIPEDVLEAGRIDGKQYMIPTGTFVRLLAYNADVVAAAGAPEPTDDMTWEDYADWLHEVQAGLPEGTYATEIESASANSRFTFTSWVIGHGQQMFDDDGLGFDKQTLADWFQFWLDLTDDGVTVPPSMISEQGVSLELTPMALGTAAVATRDIPHIYITEQTLQGNGQGTAVGSVSIPSQEPDRSANVLGSNGLSIPENCDNIPAAAAFIDFFANDVDAALAFQSDNGILTNTAAQDALLADEDTPEGVKRNVATLRALTEAGDTTTSTYPAGLTTLTNELDRLYQAVAFGELTVDAAVDEFFATAERALA